MHRSLHLLVSHGLLDHGANRAREVIRIPTRFQATFYICLQHNLAFALSEHKGLRLTCVAEPHGHSERGRASVGGDAGGVVAVRGLRVADQPRHIAPRGIRHHIYPPLIHRLHQPLSNTNRMQSADKYVLLENKRVIDYYRLGLQYKAILHNARHSGST